MTPSKHGEYLLANSASPAETRLNLLANLFDPVTFSHLEGLGITDGWRCWEVGAGGPSVARWMAARVGESGTVIASDIDITHLGGLSDENVQVLTHDVGSEPAPGSEFDLVHARLVLTHVRRRDDALQSMFEALRPGGWMLIEDADPGLQPLSCVDPISPDEELANRIREGFRALMSERGADLAFGRKLPRLLREVGLVEVRADAWFPVSRPACSRLEVVTIAMIRDLLLANAIATEEEIQRHLANAEAGLFDFTQPPLISAWGRHP